MTPSAKFTSSLLPLSRNWRRAVDLAMAPFALSEAFAGPLVFLKRSGGGITQNELAELSGIGGASLVRIVDRLVATGLIERKVDPDDKRARQLDLTKHGHAMAEQMEQALNSLRAQVLDGVTEAELDICNAVIARLNAGINDALQSFATGQPTTPGLTPELTDADQL